MSEQEEGKAGIQAQMKQLQEKMDTILEREKEQKKGLKYFKLPWNVNSKVKSAYKKGKILIFLLTTDRIINPLIAVVREGIIYINDIPHKYSTDFVYLWKGKHPALIIPEWSLTPIGTKEYYDAKKDGTANVEDAAIIIRAIQASKLEDSKKKGNMGMWIMLFIGALILAYIIFANKK